MGARISWNYTTSMTIVVFVIAALLVLRFMSTGGIPMLRMMGGSGAAEPGIAGLPGEQPTPKFDAAGQSSDPSCGSRQCELAASGGLEPARSGGRCGRLASNRVQPMLSRPRRSVRTVMQFGVADLADPARPASGSRQAGPAISPRPYLPPQRVA